MLVLAVQTGLRISELIGLSRGDVVLERGAHVRCMGKGRKERATPLTRLTVAVLREWLADHRGQPSDPLLPTRTGTRLGLPLTSRDRIRVLSDHSWEGAGTS
jgi:integrase